MDEKEILVVPFIGQGHILPCIELCNHFTARGFNATLFIASNFSSSIAPSVRNNPKIEILEIPQPPITACLSGADAMNVFEERHKNMGLLIEGLLSERSGKRPICAVIDTMLWSTRDVFWKLGIPTVTFFTSGVNSQTVELCAWKSGVKKSDIKPGKSLRLPGLPEEMALSYNELKWSPRLPPGFEGGPPGESPLPVDIPGLTQLGQEPKWMQEVDGSVGLMLNTCEELEGQFLKYLSTYLEIPVWAVGPLLPEDYWNPSGTLVRDGKLRASRRSNYTEDEVVEWLDSKPEGSVLYISFGSELSPSYEEFDQLAKALEESDRPFIWALQLESVAHSLTPSLHPGTANASSADAYFPSDLASKVKNRALIIKGWAPQLMILSHPSIGGFLSHCGWNSTVEAIGRGIPILAWPIRGDQFSDAKLVVSLLKTGYMVTDDFSESVEKEQIANGIELMMSDQEMKKRAEAIAAEFGKGIPPSSVAALDAFSDFITSSK